MDSVVNFQERTFFEQVSLAAREPVYTAALAWFLGENSPLCLAERLGILAAISGADTTNGHAIHVCTEWENIDLLITVKDAREELFSVAIENKIKSTEGQGQLKKALRRFKWI